MHAFMTVAPSSGIQTHSRLPHPMAAATKSYRRETKQLEKITPVTLNANWKRLGMGFRAQRDAGKSALQQRHQAGVPISDHEQHKKWHGDVIFIFYRVIDRQREISPDQQLHPRHPSQPFAVS